MKNLETKRNIKFEPDPIPWILIEGEREHFEVD